jgi:hypothetical protein
MAIGLVNDDDWNKELKQTESSNLSEASIKEIPSKGRDEGDVNVPDSLRKIIGEEAVINGRQEALRLAGEFDISPSSVSAYAKGTTSTATYHSPTGSIIGHINRSKERAIRKASKTLNGALGAITQEKLDYSDAKDLSGIAKDMSVIIKNLEPSEPTVTEGNKSPQFVIFAPVFRKEESFEVIQVTE